MRAPVSVVIPTLNAAEELPLCLASLFAGVQAGLVRELVISDGGSGDDTVKLAEQAGAVLVTGAASRGGQLHRGAQVAEGAWLLFLHADSQLSAGWSAAVEAHLEQAEMAGYFALGFDQGGLAGGWVAGWANLRSRLFGLPYGDQGLLIHRDLYDRLGGFENIALMEDVAMARRLKGRLRRLDAVLRTSALRYRRDGWLRRGLRNFLILLRYRLGADPEVLARAYRK